MISSVLNELFSNAPLQTRLRKITFLAGGAFAWLILALLLHPPSLLPGFIRTVGGIFTSLAGILKPGGGEDFIAAGLRSALYLWYLLGQVIAGLFSANVLRHVLVVFVPFFLAYRIAVMYLDDIFELHDEQTAFRYLRQTAFGIRPYRLTIENGGVARQDSRSPLLHIGGPGQVQVNLENLAVFDRIDGSPHIIGPTASHSSGRAAIDSFERLRDVIDLRDQMTRAEDLSLEARTRDGIRIILRDVRLMFSILRTNASGRGPGEQSYTYRDDAVNRLVYNRTSRHWTDSMLSLVQEHLEEFIARHTLGQILTAIGLPELEANRSAAAQIDAQATTMFPVRGASDSAGAQPIPLGPPPDFVPRLEITFLFYDSLHGFPTLARERGVQLHWIDVGTWSLPSGVIPQKQLEAWRLARENQERRKELAALEEESRLEELVRLVRQVPLIAFQKCREENISDEETIASLIVEYLGLMRSVRDSAVREERPIPTRLEHAILLASLYLKGHQQSRGEVHYIP